LGTATTGKNVAIPLLHKKDRDEGFLFGLKEGPIKAEPRCKTQEHENVYANQPRNPQMTEQQSTKFTGSLKERPKTVGVDYNKTRRLGMTVQGLACTLARATATTGKIINGMNSGFEQKEDVD